MTKKHIIILFRYMKNSKYKRSIHTSRGKPIDAFESISSQNIKQRYTNRIQNMMKSSTKEHRSTDYSTIISRSPLVNKGLNVNNNLKYKYDQMVHNLFKEVDFDCAGFITLTKISYYKKIPEKIFYFFGGIFQKIKKLGGVSQKVFLTLCDQAFVKSKVQDLQQLLNNNFDMKETIRFDKISKPQNTLKHHRTQQDLSFSKYDNKIGDFEKTSKIQFKRQDSDRKMRPSSKESLKLHLNKISRKSSLSKDKNVSKSCIYAHHEQKRAQSSNKQNVSYDSLKVKQLSEKLDKQIQRNRSFIYKKCLLF